MAEDNNVFGNEQHRSNRNGSILKRLSKIIFGSKYIHPEINPESVKKNEIPPETDSYDSMSKSFSEIISGYVSEARNIEENRFIRYRDYEQMMYHPLISGALEIYPDEAIQRNYKGEILSITAKDKAVEKLVREFLFDKIKLQDIIWKITYEMCIYGDTFYEIVFNKNLDEILYLKYVSPYRIYRIEENGKLKGFKYLEAGKGGMFLNRESELSAAIMGYADKFGHSGIGISAYSDQIPLGADGQLIPPYKIVHWKIDDNRYYPYGKSILDKARVAWKQMKLLEDAAIIYRLARSPVRRVWKIDCGMLSPDKALAYVTKVKNMVRKKPIVDPVTGKINDQIKAISMVEDFWIPVRQGQSGTTIEELGGQPRMGEVDDLQYWKEQMLFSMRIPKAYMADDGTLQLSGKTLSQLDVFFAKAVERVQTFVEIGIYKLIYIYLLLKKVNPNKIKSIKIKLTPPSPYKEIQHIEFMSQKYNLAQSVINLQIFPAIYVMKEVLGLSDEEIIANIGLMQAQSVNADMVAILTGKPSPFINGPEESESGVESAEQITASEEMASTLGPPPEIPGVETATAGSAPEETAAPATQTTEPMGGEETGGEEEIPSPDDLALKSLLNIESVSGKRAQPLDEKSIWRRYFESRKNVGVKQRRLLNVLNEKNGAKSGDDFNGFTNTVVVGEIGGLWDVLKEKRRAEKSVLEESMASANSSVFRSKIEGKKKRSHDTTVES